MSTAAIQATCGARSPGFAPSMCWKRSRLNRRAEREGRCLLLGLQDAAIVEITLRADGFERRQYAVDRNAIVAERKQQSLIVHDAAIPIARIGDRVDRQF